MDDDSDSKSLGRSARLKAQMRESWSEAYQTNPLLRHFVHEPLFFLAVFALVFAASGVALILPKFWDPTPPHFSKRVRVSLLDYGQAWALRRSGEKAVRKGDWDDALARYRGAVANNLADLRSLRGLLRVLRDSPWARTSNLRTLFLVSEFTRELGQTNRADALLIADVLERHRIAELALDALRPWQNELTPEEDLVWTRALLTSGQITRFQARIDAHPERFNDNRTIALYRAAVDAGWGSVDKAVAGLETLRSALTNATERTVAARMLAAAALQRDDLVDYERALVALREAGSTIVHDDAMWWELLARHGRLEEARTLARAYDRVPPPAPFEAVQLARTWSFLGLDDLAIAMFKDHAGTYGQSLEVWATYLDLLILRGNWNEVRRVASLLRLNASVHDEILPVTLYADIRADLAEGRRNVVRDPLQKLRSTPVQNPRLTLRFAAGLTAAGEPETARHLLTQIRTNLQDSLDYWLEVVLCNRGLRDAQGMLEGADRLVAIAPNNSTAQTIRLVSLLGAREQPAEALAISLRLMGTSHPSPSTLINHAMALLLNSRADEALQILDSIPRDKLQADELNSFAIARTDALYQKGRYIEAVAIGGSVDSTVLLPPQEQWFRDILHQIRIRASVADRGTP